MNSGVQGTQREFRVASASIAAGSTLIEASAGTGKTFNIALTVLRLLLETDVEHQPIVKNIGAILVVTFTKAATEELVGRIRQKLRLAEKVWSGSLYAESTGEIEQLREMANGKERWALERIREALAALDTLSVLTIHAFCHRILSEYALESGSTFGVRLIEDEQPLVQEAMNDWWRRTFYIDAQLADWLVAQEKVWTPKSFMENYRLWTRWPDTRIDPDVELSVVRQQVSQAIGSLLVAVEASETGSAGILQFLNDIPWKKDKPLGTAAARERLVASIEQLSAGSLRAAQVVADHLAIESLESQISRRTTVGKNAVKVVSTWPIALAASSLGVTLRSLKKALIVDCLRFTHGRTAQYKNERNQVGFDDVLRRVYDVLQNQGSDGLLAQTIRKEFQAALIDEFQDTDSLQFHIFHSLFAGCPLFLIGDPKQSIYAFRGADLRAYLAAAGTAQNAYTLSGNFRSSTAMVEAVNTIFANAELPFVDEGIEYFNSQSRTHPAPDGILDGNHALEWLFVPPVEDAKGLKNATVEESRRMIFDRCVEIIRQHLAGGWKPNSIAVLVRTAFEGAEIAKRLADVGIPVVLSRQGDVMQSPEAAELLWILEAIAAPHKSQVVRAAASTLIWGSDYNQVRRTMDGENDAEWVVLHDYFTELREIWASSGVLPCIDRLIRMRDVVPRLLGYIGGRRRVTNIRHLTEMLYEFSEGDSLSIEETIQVFAAKRSEGVSNGDTRELRLDTDDDAVQVTTVHSSKGLEYDIVLCPTLWGVRQPDREQSLLVHDNEQAIFDLGSEQHNKRLILAERDRLAEDCRLVYVALTRAVHRTYVAWGPIGSKELTSVHSGLSWLLAGGSYTSAIGALAGDPGRWKTLLENIVGRNPDLMKFTDASYPRGLPSKTDYQPTMQASLRARVLSSAPSPNERFSTFAVTSFTSLSAGNSDAALDAAAEDELHTGSGAVSPGVVTLPSDPKDFRTFPAGAQAGLALHSLLEEIAFDASDNELMEAIPPVLNALSVNETEREPRTVAVLGMLRVLLRQTIVPWGFSLHDVSRSKTRREWQFLVSMATENLRLSRESLAKVFSEYGGEFSKGYADYVGRLGFRSVHGFLTGFVDLVFEHDSRWYIVDWKSNQLGAEQSAYHKKSLENSMNESHYTLQYHLYALALHRFLKQRVPGYSYDLHFGGIGYAFLRGFEATLPAGGGWFVDRPSIELIEALDDLFTGTPSLRRI